MTTHAIRRATAEDARAIAELHVEGWRWAHRGLLPDAVLDGLSVAARAAMWREILAAPDAQARVWLAERGGVPIGFAATAPTRERGQPPLTGELTALYLAERVAGTGAGRALLERASDDLRQRGFRGALVWVLATNARARRFYEIAGWRPDGASRRERRGGGEVDEVRYARAFEGVPPVAPEIRTARLVLRAWRAADLAPFAALNADPRVMEHFPSPLSRAESDAAADRIARHVAQRGFGLWAMEVPGVADFIGFVGLVYTEFAAPFTPAVEVGWRLSAAHWGCGYATEGARQALAVGFGQLGLDEIVSMTVPTNQRSRRVMEKLGMHRAPEDDFDHPRIAEGHPLRRHVLYRLARAEWASQVASGR